MRTGLPAVFIVACLAFAGCRTDPAITALERENRYLEDEIYELQDVLDRTQAALDGCRRENIAMKRRTESSRPSTEAPPGRSAAPETRLPETRGPELNPSTTGAAPPADPLELGEARSELGHPLLGLLLDEPRDQLDVLTQPLLQAPRRRRRGGRARLADQEHPVGLEARPGEPDRDLGRHEARVCAGDPEEVVEAVRVGNGRRRGPVREWATGRCRPWQWWADRCRGAGPAPRWPRGRERPGVMPRA